MSGKVQMDAPRLWLVLSRCHRSLNLIAERSIEEAGLCLTDFAALEALLHKGPLTITARVNYRHLRQSYLNNVLGKDHPAYPVNAVLPAEALMALGEDLGH